LEYLTSVNKPVTSTQRIPVKQQPRNRPLPFATLCRSGDLDKLGALSNSFDTRSPLEESTAIY